MLSNSSLNYAEVLGLVFDRDCASLMQTAEIVHRVVYGSMSWISDHDVNSIDFYDHVRDYEKNSWTSTKSKAVGEYMLYVADDWPSIPLVNYFQDDEMIDYEGKKEFEY